MRYVLIVTTGLALAACGPGSPSAAKAPVDQKQAATAYADCLRQHGVPANNDGTITITGGNGPRQDQVQAAMQACDSLRPKGAQGAAGGAANQQAFAQLLQYAACLRQHGANVPDPKRDPTTGAISFVVPHAQTDPALQAAEQACSSLRPTPASGS